MSFAHTGAGARLIVLWGQPALSRELGLGLRQAELFPVEPVHRHRRPGRRPMNWTSRPADGSEWTSQINLHPAPPDGVRWLEVAAPPGPAVRVDLDPGSGRRANR